MHDDLPQLSSVIQAVGFGLACQVLAHRWHIPAIVLLLVTGLVLGPAVLDWVRPSELGAILPILVKLAVAIILFEGALNLRLRSLKTTAKEIRNLVTVGVLVSWFLTTFFAAVVAKLDLPLAFLFGALMTVTGPTVVQPLLKRMSVPRTVKNILEGEAIVIDPIGAILAVAVLDVVLVYSTNKSIGVFAAIWSYVGRLAIGAVVGFATARIASWLMRIPRLIPNDLSNLVVLGFVWVSFVIAEKLQSEAGIMTAVAMGLAFQREGVPGERQLRQFKETLTTLSISVLFILLAANLKVSTLKDEGLRGILTILAVMFVVRPIGVFASTIGSSLNWREKALIAWIGPRGIVAASVASLFGLSLAGAGIEGAQRLPALTFLAIIMTVTIQGLSASRIAKLLGLQSMAGLKVFIVGANRLGQILAGILKEHGRPISFLDTNQANAQRASDAGFSALVGNALDEDVLESSGIDGTETLVSMTSNSEVNVLVSQMARDVFGIARAFPVLHNPDRGAGPKFLQQTGGRLGFGRSIDFLSWEHADVERLVWEIPPTFTTKQAGQVQIHEDLLPMVRLRGTSAEVVHAEQPWQSKDRIVFITRMPLDQARAQLGI